MTLTKKIFSALLPILACSMHASAAGTFTTVYDLLQVNCSASGCHGGASPIVFSVDGSEADVYNALVGVTAANSAAAAKGYKLVDPGHPYNSFLLKKIGVTLDNYLALGTGEGDPEPRDKPALQKHEIELIRQWILSGARQTGNNVDYQLLQDYYSKGGLDFIPVPDAPAPSKGMQLRYGPIFLAPDAEVEWDKKEHLHNPNPVRVYRTGGYMSWESHHMLLFKYDDDGSGVREGTRLVPSEAAPFNGNTTLTGAWQDDGDFELPAKTAFYWAANTTLDFDYHVKNYSHTEILPTDFYLNIYYDTENTRNIEMHAQLVNNLALILGQGENTKVATESFNEDRYIYMLSSHTHKWGTDFDIYVRNADGSRGNQIYEGWFNYEQNYNRGSYDWEHPPVEYFTDLQKASRGLIYEVKWNVGVPFVTFGLTTNDEMMLFTYLYTNEEIPSTPTATAETVIDKNELSVSPNPFSASAEISYSIEQAADVQLDVYNLLGKRVATLVDAQMNPGNHTNTLNSGEMSNESGIYFVTLKVGGEIISTRKVSLF